MTRVIATQVDVGRSCPYCRFPLKEGTAERCDACNSLHHEDCWNDGGGCAVLGCPGAGTAVFATASPQASTAQPHQPAAAAQPGYGAPGVYMGPPGAGGVGGPPGYPQFPTKPDSSGGVGATALIVAVVIAVAGIATGVLVAGGVLTGKGQAGAVTVTGKVRAQSRREPAKLTVAEQQSKRAGIMAVLGLYQTAYSNHDPTALSSIFTPGIKRHGLAAGGCSVVEGRTRVLQDYETQFSEGTGAYTLVGLTANQIQLDGPTRAHLHANYQISTGGAGYVNFNFAELGGSWKISQIDATCA